MMSRRRHVAVAALAALVASALTASAGDPPAGGGRPMTGAKKADDLFGKQNWMEARAEYDALFDAHPKDALARHAAERAVDCSVRLQLWDDAGARAEGYVEKNEGGYHEALGARYLAALYLRIPHYGTKRAGKLLRGQHGQGVRVTSARQDRRKAVRHYERAREVLEGLADSPRKLPPGRGLTAGQKAGLTALRIEVDFDLASVLLNRTLGGGYYGWRGYYGWWPWDWWWWGWGWYGSLDGEGEDDTSALEDADYEEPRRYNWHQRSQEPPRGIPVDDRGNPRFIVPAGEYDAKLSDAEKIRYLLDDVIELDGTEKGEQAARALLRRAMIARQLYGPDSIRQYQQQRRRYDPMGRPLPADDADDPLVKIHELARDEALAWVGGQVKRITLPPDEDPLALLDRVEKDYPLSSCASEARYAAALYLQSRSQFPEAVADYDKVVNRYANTHWAEGAGWQIAKVKEPDVALERAGVALPDGGAPVEFTYRNVREVRLRAYRFEMERFVKDGMTADDGDRFSAWRQVFSPWRRHHRTKEVPYKPYVGEMLFNWNERVENDGSLRPVTLKRASPIAKPGAYLIEAEVDGGRIARNLLLVSDVALLYKSMPGKGLLFLADARTGKPLAETAITVYEHQVRWVKGILKRGRNVHDHVKSDVETDARGIVEYKQRKWRDVDAVCFLKGDRMAFTFLYRWNTYDYGRHAESGMRAYVVTDRPVYRPLQDVKFKVWMRERRRGAYREPGRGSVRIEVYDPKGSAVRRETLKLDEMGGADGSFTLSSEPPLGVYRITVNGHSPNARTLAGGLFRVEEYKKPEFEVVVKPDATQAKLGRKIRAKVEARYYFGAPVVAAEVSYKVFREDYRHVYAGPGEYDWLYGKGYGRSYYAYPWFYWWGHWGYSWHWYPPYRYRARFPWGWYGGGGNQWETSYRRWLEGSPRKALRELVATGRGKTDEEGLFQIEIDTARALAEHPGTDSRYTIEADVRDASRRTISGEGSVIASRRAFYAFLDADRGWYRSGKDVFVELRCLTADNVPVSTEGELVAYNVNYGGRRNERMFEKRIGRRRASTDAGGRYSTKFTFRKPGQYRIRFRTDDAEGEPVEANALVWVAGPDFDGKRFKFNDLEVITDKRTYEVGDVAHLMVNTGSADTSVLLSLEAGRGQIRSYRLIEVPGRSKVIDVPVKREHVPNFFVEATTIHGGKVFQEMRELLVPPKDGLLEVELSSDKAEYRPGEKGKVRVSVRDKDGRPRAAQIALVAYDKAVTYIQPEFGPGIRTFFWGQKRYHHPQYESTVDHVFHPDRSIARMEQQLWHGGQMPSDWGGWGANVHARLDQSLRGRSPGSMARYASVAKATAAGEGAAADAASAAPAGPGGGFGEREAEEKREDRAGGMDGGATAMPVYADAAVRAKFADTALWVASLDVDETGEGEAEITFPENLTTWRLRGYGMTRTTAVGEAEGSVVTTKNLIVRLQAPRFFVERDEVVLSANVHNYLAEAKRAKVTLTLEGECLESMGELEAFVDVKANGEARVDFPVKVIKDGMPTITATALTDEESDAMKMAFPALVHGIEKTVATSAAFKVDQEGEKVVVLPLPREINPEATELVVTLSPSLAGAMIDALPYLAGYPYGCVEQTLSRFVPTVVVAKALKDSGIDLETVGKKRLELMHRRKDLAHRFRRLNPVFDSKELERMIRAGLDRIMNFQHADGGWGWWREDESSPYTTAHAVQGLKLALDAGVNVDRSRYQRGIQFLARFVDKELKQTKHHRWYGGIHMQAYLAYVLSAEKRADATWLGNIFEERGRLNLYSKALLAMALHRTGMPDEAGTTYRNILQFVEEDRENDTAWVRTPQVGWWYWWNNDIETNAFVLSALAELDPQGDLGPRLVKWLLNNRKNGYYWRSTRDTAHVIAAMTKYMKASGEGAPDYTVFVTLDGRRELLREEVTRDVMFTFRNRITLDAASLPPGPHTLTIRKQGRGALYYSTYLSFFTKEEDVEGAGNEVFIDRKYYRMTQVEEEVVRGEGDTRHTEKRLTYRRDELTTGDAVKSGDMIEVVLAIESKNDYDFLVFEDMKPAGCEPVELRSGGRWAGGLCANVELRDTKVAFFVGMLQQGEHVLKYRLRAEVPGKFHALPTKGWAMYAPEIKAISDEMRLGIED